MTAFSPNRLALAAVLLMLAPSGIVLAADASPAIVAVEAGEFDRVDTPVVFEAAWDVPADARLSLTDLDSGAEVPVQRLPGKKTRLVWLLSDRLSAGHTRQYRLNVARDGEAEVAATCVAADGWLKIDVEGKPVLRYAAEVQTPPEELSPVYRRSGFIHPLFDPEGRILTDDFPPDHAHQHGVFFAWVNTTFEGRKIDFWNQAAETGRIEHVETLGTQQGPVFAQFTTKLRHLDITTPDAPRPVLEERWVVRVCRLTDYFLFDLTSAQTCVAKSPLVINEYHYGGMALRGAREWFEQPEHDMLTSDGATRKDGNHTRPVWVEMYGNIQGKPSGVTIMGSPQNHGYPQPVRLHPTKPYLCFAPMVLGEFSIEPGQPYISRYRLVAHVGKPDPNLNERIWNDYAHPPKVRVVKAPTTQP